jgi:hypothetical protein
VAQPTLDQIARRPARYWTIDGLPELMLGLLWMTWGGAWLAGQRLPHDWRWTAYWLVLPPALAAAALALNRITRRLKERVTFPRAGYVAWKAPERSAARGIAVAIVVAAIILAAATTAAASAGLERNVPAVVSVILALSFVAISVRQRTPYHLALAGAVIVLAVAVNAIATGWDAMNWLFVALGALCVVVGGVRLALFVRSHPVVSAEEA